MDAHADLSLHWAHASEITFSAVAVRILIFYAILMTFAEIVLINVLTALELSRNGIIQHVCVILLPNVKVRKKLQAKSLLLKYQAD